MKEMITESNFLNDRQVEDLQMVAEITNAMAVSDGFPNLDACLKKFPQRLDIYNRYAIAALQAMRRVQGYTTGDGTKEPSVIGTTLSSLNKKGQPDS